MALLQRPAREFFGKDGMLGVIGSRSNSAGYRTSQASNKTIDNMMSLINKWKEGFMSISLFGRKLIPAEEMSAIINTIQQIAEEGFKHSYSIWRPTLTGELGYSKGQVVFVVDATNKRVTYISLIDNNLVNPLNDIDGNYWERDKTDFNVSLPSRYMHGFQMETLSKNSFSVEKGTCKDVTDTEDIESTTIFQKELKLWDEGTAKGAPEEDVYLPMSDILNQDGSYCFSNGLSSFIIDAKSFFINLLPHTNDAFTLTNLQYFIANFNSVFNTTKLKQDVFDNYTFQNTLWNHIVGSTYSRELNADIFNIYIGCLSATSTQNDLDWLIAMREYQHLVFFEMDATGNLTTTPLDKSNFESAIVPELQYFNVFDKQMNGLTYNDVDKLDWRNFVIGRNNPQNISAVGVRLKVKTYVPIVISFYGTNEPTITAGQNKNITDDKTNWVLFEKVTTLQTIGFQTLDIIVPNQENYTQRFTNYFVYIDPADNPNIIDQKLEFQEFTLLKSSLRGCLCTKCVQRGYLDKKLYIYAIKNVSGNIDIAINDEESLNDILTDPNIAAKQYYTGRKIGHVITDDLGIWQNEIYDLYRFPNGCINDECGEIKIQQNGNYVYKRGYMLLNLKHNHPNEDVIIFNSILNYQNKYENLTKKINNNNIKTRLFQDYLNKINDYYNLHSIEDGTPDVGLGVSSLPAIVQTQMQYHRNDLLLKDKTLIDFADINNEIENYNTDIDFYPQSMWSAINTIARNVYGNQYLEVITTKGIENVYKKDSVIIKFEYTNAQMNKVIGYIYDKVENNVLGTIHPLETGITQESLDIVYKSDILTAYSLPIDATLTLETAIHFFTKNILFYEVIDQNNVDSSAVLINDINNVINNYITSKVKDLAYENTQGLYMIGSISESMIEEIKTLLVSTYALTNSIICNIEDAQGQHNNLAQKTFNTTITNIGVIAFDNTFTQSNNNIVNVVRKPDSTNFNAVDLFYGIFPNVTELNKIQNAPLGAFAFVVQNDYTIGNEYRRDSGTGWSVYNMQGIDTTHPRYKGFETWPVINAIPKANREIGDIWYDTTNNRVIRANNNKDWYDAGRLSIRPIRKEEFLDPKFMGTFNWNDRLPQCNRADTIGCYANVVGENREYRKTAQNTWTNSGQPQNTTLHCMQITFNNNNTIPNPVWKGTFANPTQLPANSNDGDMAGVTSTSTEWIYSSASSSWSDTTNPIGTTPTTIPLTGQVRLYLTFNNVKSGVKKPQVLITDNYNLVNGANSYTINQNFNINLCRNYFNDFNNIQFSVVARFNETDPDIEFTTKRFNLNGNEIKITLSSERNLLENIIDKISYNKYLLKLVENNIDKPFTDGDNIIALQYQNKIWLYAYEIQDIVNILNNYYGMNGNLWLDYSSARSRQDPNTYFYPPCIRSSYCLGQRITINEDGGLDTTNDVTKVRDFGYDWGTYGFNGNHMRSVKTNWDTWSSVQFQMKDTWTIWDDEYTKKFNQTIPRHMNIIYYYCIGGM